MTIENQVDSHFGIALVQGSGSPVFGRVDIDACAGSFIDYRVKDVETPAVIKSEGARLPVGVGDGKFDIITLRCELNDKDLAGRISSRLPHVTGEIDTDKVRRLSVSPKHRRGIV
jgi:hypothetical protein